MKSIVFNVSFKACVSFFIFILDDLSIGGSGVLKSPTMIVFWCRPPSGWGWSRGLCKLPGGRDWCLPSGRWSWVLSFWWAGPQHAVCFQVSLSLIWLVSLLADGWGCIPVLLCVWPEAFSTGVFRQLHGAETSCWDGDLQVSSHWLIFPGA